MVSLYPESFCDFSSLDISAQIQSMASSGKDEKEKITCRCVYRKKKPVTPVPFPSNKGLPVYGIIDPEYNQK